MFYSKEGVTNRCEYWNGIEWVRQPQTLDVHARMAVAANAEADTVIFIGGLTKEKPESFEPDGKLGLYS